MYYELLEEINDNNVSKNLNNKKNLNDNDLINIYNFFIYKGYFNIISIQIFNVITSLFLYFLILFLFLCIDYHGLLNIKNEEKEIKNYLNFSNLKNTHFFYITCMLFVFIHTIIKINNIIIDSFKYYKIKKFYQNILKINNKQINLISWNEIINILKDKYGKEYNSYNINTRILRKDNILIDIYNTKLNSLLYSSLMEWNINYCLLSSFFDDNNNVDNKIFENSYQIKKSIKINILIVILLTFIFMPFIILYMIFFCVLKYGPNFYNYPSKISSRQWSLRSRWRLRYYNELKHELDKRLNISSFYAKEVCRERKTLVIESIIKFLIFMASSFFMILLFLTILNENLLFNLNITNNKPVIWYMGILGSIIAIGKNFTKETKNDVKDNNYNKLLNKIKLISFKNGNEIEKLKIKKKISKYYEYQVYTLLKECLTVIIVPILLINLLKNIDKIYDNIIENIELDSNLGYISKKSNFINIDNNTKKETLLSFHEFRNNYNWGENIENFLIDSKLYEQIKSTNIEDEKSFNEKFIMESQVSVI